MIYTNQERFQMVQACRDAGGLLGIGSERGKLLMAAARVIEPSFSGDQPPQEEMRILSAACLEAVKSLPLANRKAGLERAGNYLHNLAADLMLRLPPKKRQPLKPLRLTIFCTPEGGWIAEGDTQQRHERNASLAAFSNAGDLLCWLTTRLSEHENADNMTIGTHSE